MKTQTVRVRVNDRIETFANAKAAENYRRKWGGEILGANEPAKLGSFSALPTINPYHAALLGLPGNVTPSEFQTAWQANGCSAAVLNTPKVREALITLAMREQGMSRERATDYVRVRCPKLFPLSKIGSGANEKPGMKREGVAAYLASGEKMAANEILLAIGRPVKFAA